MKTKLAAAVMLFLLTGIGFFSVTPYSRQASAQTGVQGFQIISSEWGTATASAQPGPGNQNVPLTVTLEYLYPFSSISTEFEIKLPSGFSAASSEPTGTSNATIYYAGRLSEGQIFQVQAYLDLSNNLTLGTYIFPTTILWYAILSNSTSSPEVFLEQKTNITLVLNGDSQLSYSASEGPLVPGEINYVPLTLTNLGTGNASKISTTLSLGNSQSVSILSELPEIEKLNANSSVSETLQLYVSPSAAQSPVSLSLVTAYQDPYDNQQSVTQTLGLFVGMSPSSGSQIVFRAIEKPLTPGGVNNISLIATNAGSQGLSDITTQVSSSSPSISVLAPPSTVQSLPVGSSIDLQLSMFVSSSASNTPVTITISTLYLVSGTQASGSSSESLGLYTSSGNASTASSAAISITEMKADLTAGRPSTVSFLITNTGDSAIYRPTISISVGSPLVVYSNSTFTLSGSILANGNMVYESSIITSPSATPGAYEGSLTITYVNQDAASNTQVVQVGFILTGTIDLVVQDEQVTQSTGNLTVSGTLLNEGTAPAYYSSVAGTLGSGAKSGPSTYIGEIDPNTPVPFTAVVPYTSSRALSSAEVDLAITYKDNFGNIQNTSVNQLTTITSNSVTSPSTSNISSSAGQGLVIIAFYVIVIAVAMSGVMGALFVRRNRRKRNIESGDDNGTQDQKVV